MANRLLLAAFLLLFLQAGAMEVATEKSDYVLGEKILLSGSCSGGNVGVTVSYKGLSLMELLARCSASHYEVSLPTDFSFPSGSWTIGVASGSESASAEVFVSAPRESRLLDIRVLSPSVEAKTRASEIVLNVEIVFGGEKIDAVSVYTWNSKGSKIQLAPKGNGVYEVALEIPHDFPSGSWPLLVTAVYTDSVFGLTGGEQTIALPIVAATGSVGVISPKVWVFLPNVEEEIVIKPVYSNGKPVSMPSIRAVIDGKDVVFEGAGAGLFAGKIYFLPEQSGYHSLEIAVSDAAGNSFSGKFEVFVEKSILPTQSDLSIYAVIAVVAILGIGLFLYWRDIHKMKGDVSERDKVLDEIKKLQSDYFQKKRMTEDSYRMQLRQLEAKLSGIDSKFK